MEKHNTAMAEKLYAKPEARSLTAKSEKPSRVGDDPVRQRRLMVAMWQRMKSLFGISWETQYGGVNDPGISAWGNALKNLTEQQLATGIREAQNWQQEFPPSLPQFARLCLTKAKPNYTERRMATEKQEGKSVSVMEHLARNATSDCAKREIERMQKLLAGEEVETKEESYQKLGLPKRWGAL